MYTPTPAGNCSSVNEACRETTRTNDEPRGFVTRTVAPRSPDISPNETRCSAATAETSVRIAPECEHCHCRMLGHGVEVDGRFFCCAHCARTGSERGAEISDTVGVHQS